MKKHIIAWAVTWVMLAGAYAAMGLTVISAIASSTP